MMPLSSCLALHRGQVLFLRGMKGFSYATTISSCTVAFRQDGKEVAVTATNDCQRGTPAVTRVNPDKPQQSTPLQPVNAENPAWQFLSTLP